MTNYQQSADALPKLLQLDNGETVTSTAQWRQRREELLERILDIEYGALPPEPDDVELYTLHPFKPFPGVNAAHIRITCRSTGFFFTMTLFFPDGDGPFATIVDGDGCWRYITDEIIQEIASRGFALALFSRVDIVPDNHDSRRDVGLYVAYPEHDFRAIAAWAWAYHRVIDAITKLPRIDSTRIIAVGHSRGGKAALLAGATDERIALTAPNNSGFGGAGSFHFPDPGSETLEHVQANFPYWFSPKLFDYIGREAQLPFDQHALKALVAPRSLLTTEALGDIWASPHGTYVTHTAAREVYRLLGAESALGIYFREGGHAHTVDDWRVMLDFAEYTLYDKQPVRDFHSGPPHE